MGCVGQESVKHESMNKTVEGVLHLRGEIEMATSTHRILSPVYKMQLTREHEA